MSKRRKVGEVVRLDDEDEGPYLARIVLPKDSRGPDECPGLCSDRKCQEWPIVVILDERGEATGTGVYHVPECHMQDAQDAQDPAV